jgi:hypothetical protein
MSPTEPQPPVAPAAAAPESARNIRLEEVILVALFTLSAVGIAISKLAPEDALWYWLAMVPVFGGISLVFGWSRARAQGMTPGVVVRSQLLHWLALAVAVCLVFLLEYTGRMTNADAGLVVLLTLALTTFLAGVHFDWRFCAVGAVLAAAVAAVALLKQFVWVVVIAAVAVAAFLVYRARRRDPGGTAS